MRKYSGNGKEAYKEITNNCPKKIKKFVKKLLYLSEWHCDSFIEPIEPIMCILHRYKNDNKITYCIDEELDIEDSFYIGPLKRRKSKYKKGWLCEKL